MKAKMIAVGFLSLILFTLNVNAQEQTIQVKMEKVPGKFPSIASYPAEQIEKNKSAFELPVDSSRCMLGFFSISFINDWYNLSRNNDSLMQKFENFLAKIQADTMQFVNHRLMTTRLYCCSWIEGDFKNVVIDTDCDSSFTDEDVLKYNMRKGFCDIFDTSRATAVVNISLRYDSMNIRKHASVPILVILNQFAEGSNIPNDSLVVGITVNEYLKGDCTINGIKTEIFMDAMNFDQFYVSRKIMGKYSCEYFNSKSYFSFMDTIMIHNNRYVIDYFDYLTKTLTLRFDKTLKTGLQPGDYFAVSPEIEDIMNYKLVFFTATWCGACKHVLDSLKKFHKLVPEVEIVNINTEQDSARMNNYVKWNGIDWKVIFDQQLKGKESEYWKTYGISGIPVLVLVNYNRTVLLYGSGSGAGGSSCESVIGKILENGPEYFERPTQ